MGFWYSCPGDGAVYLAKRSILLWHILRAEEQQVVIATAAVHQWQQHTSWDSLISIHKLICQLEDQGVIIMILSSFSNPYGQCKSSVKTGEANSGLLWPPLSTALLDMLELQHKLESKAMKLYATIDNTNAFSWVSLVTECRYGTYLLSRLNQDMQTSKQSTESYDPCTPSETWVEFWSSGNFLLLTLVPSRPRVH